MSKIALVTGAGTGVGRAAAVALAAAGYTVVLNGRRPEPLEAVRAEIAAAGGKADVIAADVADPASVATLFATLKAHHGRLDVLFNNAGVGAPPVPIEELSFEHWKACVDINLTGSFLCTQEAFRIMKDQTPQGGRIINNGSISAHAPRPFSIAYTATKHAVTGLTRSTALDGRAYDIAATQIDIGNAATDMTVRMRTTGVLQANLSTAVEATFDPAHVGAAIVSIAALPLDTTVLFMTIMATKMPFVGRG